MLLSVRPWSVSAFVIGGLVVMIAAGIQALFFLFGAHLYFAAFLPAVFLAGFLAGAPAATVVALLTVPLVWWAFIPPVFVFNPLAEDHVDAIRTFLLLSALLIFLTDICRSALAICSGSRSQATIGRPTTHADRSESA